MEHDYTLSYIHRGNVCRRCADVSMQAAKQEDEWLENRKREENE